MTTERFCHLDVALRRGLSINKTTTKSSAVRDITYNSFYNDILLSLNKKTNRRAVRHVFEGRKMGVGGGCHRQMFFSHICLNNVTFLLSFCTYFLRARTAH